MLETVIDGEFLQQSEVGSISQSTPNAESTHQMMTHFKLEVFALSQIDLLLFS